MSSGGLLISIGMLLIGLVWLALPYVRGSRTVLNEQRDALRERPQLAARYERALMTVRDLDEDYQVGKLSPEQYAAERARWVEEGAVLLEALEKTGGVPEKKAKKTKVAVKTVQPVAVDPAPVATTNDDPVEQAIAAYVRAREQARGK
jgi:hypothetical protein